MKEFNDWLEKVSAESRPLVLSISALDSLASAVYHFDRGFSFGHGKIRFMISDKENRVVIPMDGEAEKIESKYVCGYKITKGKFEITVVAN